MLLEVPSLRTVNCSNETLLGFPIGDVDCIDDVIMRKIEMLQLMGERLNLLCSHDALTLLRHSFFYSESALHASHFSMIFIKPLKVL